MWRWLLRKEPPMKTFLVDIEVYSIGRFTIDAENVKKATKEAFEMLECIGEVKYNVVVNETPLDEGPGDSPPDEIDYPPDVLKEVEREIGIS